MRKRNMYTYRVSDYRTENLTTDEVIRKCMDDAKSSTQRTIVFDEKEYVISRAILLPPDTTVILDGCHIMQADYIVDNVFRGTNVIVDPNQPLGMPLACEKTKNIIATSKIAVTLDNCSKKWCNMSQGDEKNGQNAAQCGVEGSC